MKRWSTVAVSGASRAAPCTAVAGDAALATKAGVVAFEATTNSLSTDPELRAAEDRAFLAYQVAVQADDRIPPRHQENAARIPAVRYTPIGRSA